MLSATLETMAGSRSRTLGGFRPLAWLPYPLPRPPTPLARSLVPFPTYPPNQLAKSPRPPSGGRGHDFQGSLGESRRSGSRLPRSPFPRRKGFGRLETRDRPLPPQRVCEANSVQDGNCLLSPPLGQRG